MRSRTAARATLAIVLLTGGMIALPRVSSNALPSAQVPTPLPTDLLSSPKPKPSPSSSKTPEGGGGGSEGGNHEGGTTENGGDGNNTKDGRDRDGKHRGNDKSKLGKSRLGKNGRRRHHKHPLPPTHLQIPGSWTTDKLVAVAAQLRSLGWSAEEVQHKVFAPFILAGPAAWVDTWHAPRYGPAPGEVRQHEGQDVFCNYGEPVLATEEGTIQFDSGGLGGNIARLFRPDGTYWYFAHLSDWNTKQFSNGDTVEPGDVIGYCGNSGDAVDTSPHVHFGWYQPGGERAMNPLSHLVDWLHEAEDHALSLVGKTAAKRIRQLPQLTTQRRFGDEFLPDMAELRVAGESLWASGSTPTTGAFALAQTALQAALSENGASPSAASTTALDNESGLLEPGSALSRLINGSSSPSSGESGG